jgi:hypothetical protein
VASHEGVRATRCSVFAPPDQAHASNPSGWTKTVRPGCRPRSNPRCTSLGAGRQLMGPILEPLQLLRAARKSKAPDRLLQAAVRDKRPSRTSSRARDELHRGAIAGRALDGRDRGGTQAVPAGTGRWMADQVGDVNDQERTVAAAGTPPSTAASV